MPVIFAQSVIFFPATIASFTKWEWLARMSAYINPSIHFWIYTPIFIAIVIFFAFFYTSIVFNPDETAENMKRSGAIFRAYAQGRKRVSIWIPSSLN